MDMIQQLARNVNERLNESGIEPAVKLWALDEMDAIGTELDRIIEADSRKQFVTSYLKQEKERYQADSVEDLPVWLDAEETRDDPLCYCSNSDCDVKKGRIPVQIDETSLLEGIRIFKQEHPGYPQALDAAGDAYLETRATVQSTLRRVYASLGSNQILDPDAEADAYEEAAAT